jgi:hypothetical protein
MLNYFSLFLYIIIFQDATGSLSNIPRGKMKLSNAGTMVANLKVNKGVCEQPSPVSVLDAPFHESSNSMHFSDIRSRLHGKGFKHMLHLHLFWRYFVVLPMCII